MNDLISNLAGRMKEEARKMSAVADPDLMQWSMEYMPHHVYYEPSRLHRELSEVLKKCSLQHGVKVCEVAPRGYAKSTWCSGIFPLYNICHSLKRYILLVSDTEAQAKHFLETIRAELENNEMIARDYPDAAGRGSVWGQDKIITRNGICIEALGTGQRIRGRKYLQFRPDLIVFDDPQSDEDIYSPTGMEKQWGWFQKGLMKCGSDDATFLVVGTMIHESCIVSRIRELAGWEYIIYRSIEQYPVNMHLWENWSGIISDMSISREEREKNARQYYLGLEEEMNEGASVLWPEKEDLYTLMVMRNEDEAAFESEKQNNPRSGKRFTFPEEFFKGDIWFDEEDLVSLRGRAISVMAVDPAKGNELRRNDYSGVITLTLVGNYLYIRPFLARLTVDKLVNYTVNEAKIYRPMAISFEENTFQYLIAEQFEKKSLEMGFPMAVNLMNNQVNKSIRIQRLSPFLSRKMFKFKKSCPYTQILLRQLRDFPYSKHDDGPDVLEMALRTLLQILENSEIPYNNIDELPNDMAQQIVVA